MQDNVGQAGDALQAATVVEVGQYWRRTSHAPLGGSRHVAQQCIDASAAGKTGKDAAGDVPAANNQYFLHGCIVADQ